MRETPQANRLHVTLFGETNAGKSALFNAITDTDLVIVSDIAGTTTDSVSKSMELHPIGPIVLTDTAGLNDTGLLGTERMAKTKKAIEKTDLALYVIDASNHDRNAYDDLKKELTKRSTDCLVVLTKKDLYREEVEERKKEFENALAVSVQSSEDINCLKAEIAKRLANVQETEASLIDGLLSSGSLVVMVVPIDSGAPKGRLILPQVQLIRACLDQEIRCLIVTESCLSQALQDNPKIDLLVTDSQIFHSVSKMVGEDIPLTSFSILMARQKGNIETLLEGIHTIENLKDGDTILIAETCTHNRTHEDIGHVKIPALLKRITGKALQFEFSTGRDYPANLSRYAMIVHCAACMITRKEMQNRLLAAQEEQISITNYGLLLAHGSGILQRAIKMMV